MRGSSMGLWTMGRERVERWFDEEEEEDDDDEREVKGGMEGETGVQDF